VPAAYTGSLFRLCGDEHCGFRTTPLLGHHASEHEVGELSCVGGWEPFSNDAQFVQELLSLTTPVKVQRFSETRVVDLVVQRYSETRVEDWVPVHLAILERIKLRICKKCRVILQRCNGIGWDCAARDDDQNPSA
jgi:hypothetical protein